ncbi:MAG: Eco57I restriction-modification methylase domain-containing protein [Oscillospiraceae bacterium]
MGTVIAEDSIYKTDKRLLELLLTDRSTNKHIVWATNDYIGYGEDFAPECEITAAQITDTDADRIRPRVTKAREKQNLRTKDKGEVFTPSWICCLQNDLVDEQWFGRADVFNTAKGNRWEATEGKIVFPSKSGRTWHDYIRAKRMEITCGEAPYLVSRYDTVTGNPIDDVHMRIGLLDRKLRIVDENTDNEADWIKWTEKAYQSVYGYEYQGDNLLIARENLLFTFADHMMNKFGRQPSAKELYRIANIISWNIWQMDGLNYTAPYSKNETNENPVPCIIRDWTNKRCVEYRALAESETEKRYKLKFDAVVGNPPYQLTNGGDGHGKDPIYHLFIDSSRRVCPRGTFIHPARCLFNAGKTPKEWNKKILNDEHFKVAEYWQDTSQVFSSVDIKGGVAVTMWDESRDFGSIGVFSAYEELRGITAKVLSADFTAFADLVYPRDLYRLTDELYKENEWAAERPSKGHKYDVGSNVFYTFPELFFDDMPNDGEEYARIFGREKASRALKWIKRKYLKLPDNFEYYKVFIPKANGSGGVGEALSMPVIGEPNVGHTVTFLSIGKFGTAAEAEACLKYIKTKFARTMLSTLKVTQDNPRETWLNVPLQDFTENSDIDWSASIEDIDRRLYEKYSLTDGEIDFIEAAAKSME